MKLPDRLKYAILRTVIEVHVAEGRGTMDDPVRLVIFYYDPDSGTLLARTDMLEEAGATP